MSAMNVTSGGGDSLTRTTLHVDAAASATLVADAVRALQRVPGVLLADLDAATARLVVRHDGAVPVTSLVAAATQAGINAHVVRTGPSRDPGAPLAGTGAPTVAGDGAAITFAPHANVRGRIMIVAMSLLVGAIVLVDVAVPNVAQKRALFDGGIVAIWIFFFASTYLRRR
jgi:hypothetical protein